MEFISKYTSKKTDAQGYAHYTSEENGVWRDLYARQIQILPGRACQEHINGLKKLNFSQNEIPQLPDINAALSKLTQWSVVPVPALISQEAFFGLLADRKFPAATFIRTREEFDYVQEPDIFHEVFGHCPLLTEPVYADFIQRFAQFVLALDKKEWPLLQRFYWFTAEFGLIQTEQGLRAYGGGILSSPKETVYCVESNHPERRPFKEGIDIFRTPYRIDRLQDIYYVIDHYETLYSFIKSDVNVLLKKAHTLGEFKPTFKEDGSPSEHIHFC